MEIYEMLKEYGVPVQLSDWCTPVHEIAQVKTNITFTPIRFEKEVAVFNSEQILKFGPPELYGYDTYEVVELQETVSPFVSDWKMEQTREKLRPIHRYNRIERFEFVIAQLLGLRGDVPQDIIDLMQQEANLEPNVAWNSIRNVLKTHKHKRYYQRIPQIMFRLGLGSVFKMNNSTMGYNYQCIIADFKKLQGVFEEYKFQTKKRVYFPNLRFIAVKLLERRGCKCNFEIDFIRTKRKIKSLGEMWDILEAEL